MRIDCFLSPTCSSEKNLKENIDRALHAEAMDAEVIFSVVNELEAARLGLKGSPSILINGTDIQPIQTPGFA